MPSSATSGLFPSTYNVKSTNAINIHRIATSSLSPSTTTVKPTNATNMPTSSSTAGFVPSTTTWKTTGKSASAFRTASKKPQSGSTSQHISRETQHYESSTPNVGHQSSITLAAKDSCGFGYWTSITVKPPGLGKDLRD